MKYYLESNDGKHIIGNLELPCESCLKKCNTLGAINDDCGLDGIPKRNGIQIGKKGKAFLCCGETKTTKLFREKLSNISYAIPVFEELKKSVGKEVAIVEHKKYKRIVHNLRSLNAHTIQELYNLVPQEYISSNIQEQFDEIKEAISENLDQAARTFIRIAKHNSHMKAEFAIQDKLVDENPILQILPHVVRKVLMNVLHIFFVDFDEVGVQVTVNPSYTKINIDYESVHVAFHHIISNASKYIKPTSTLRIIFSENDSTLTVDFEMDSLHIKQEEVEKIFDEGYSGINAVLAKKAGEGIGMARIRSLIELNKANFHVIAGKRTYKYNGLDYAQNTFKVVFNKNHNLGLPIMR